MKGWIATSALVVGLLGCGTQEEPVPTDSESANLASVPEGFGKSDNYIATNASEYIISGSATFPVPEGFASLDESERTETLEELAAKRTLTVTRVAQRQIKDMLRDANSQAAEGNPDAELIEFFLYVKSSYGGGKVNTVEVIDGQAHFDFQLELVGSLELIQIVDGEQADQKFDVEVPAADGQPAETLTLTMEGSPSTDSFPKYDAFFEDGIFDIAIIFGGDYNEERYDIETARWTVSFLFESGWENAEVSSFEELKHDSPPFTRLVQNVEGRDIEARVYIVHAQMDDDAGAPQEMLRELTETSIKERDVVIYSGHAGADAGMILDYHPRYELDDDEFAELEMSDKYQVYVFDGCNSYRTYVDKLMLNPVRTFDNTTAVTTVNTTPFSAGYEIIDRFVHWLTFSDSTTGAHYPVSWNTLLQGVNDQHPDVYYGVHGVDQDPKLNPHGGSQSLCEPCEDNTGCGAGANLCVDYEDGASCGVACTDSSACGPGFDCISLTPDADDFYIPKQCVRTSLSCQ